MKIFDQVQPWPTKTNFVDRYNVTVGYDMERDCCEEACWYIATQPRPGLWSEQSWPGDPEPYIFDLSYCMRVDDYDLHTVIFRLKAKGLQPIYLHLQNCHNGYYARDFEMTMGNGQEVRSGQI